MEHVLFATRNAILKRFCVLHRTYRLVSHYLCASNQTKP